MPFGQGSQNRSKRSLRMGLSTAQGSTSRFADLLSSSCVEFPSLRGRSFDVLHLLEGLENLPLLPILDSEGVERRLFKFQGLAG